jgi:hypothetical protein
MQLNPRVHVQVVGDETALIQFETGQFYGLNEVGTHIFSLLKKNKSKAQIVEDLAITFEVPEQQAAQDTEEFIVDLIREKILQP